MKKFVFLALAALAVSACQDSMPADAEEETACDGEEEAAEADIQLGNGEANSITVEGITRAGSVFTVPAVTIERAGFLVMHPFRDGEPVRDEYTGATPVAAGTTQGVEIDVGNAPAEGDMFIIMLHNDMNDDGAFDFGNGQDNVPDAPTFEGEMLIAHPIAAPADSSVG